MKKSDFFIKYRSSILVIVVFAMIDLSLSIAIPFALQNVISDVNGNNLNVSSLVVFFSILIATYVFSILLSKYKHRFMVRFNVEEGLVIDKLITEMDYQAIINNEPTYLINRKGQAVGHFFTLITDGVSGLFTDAFAIIVILGIMLYYNAYLVPCYIVLGLLNYFGYKKVNKNLMAKTMSLQNITATSYKNEVCFMENVDFIKQLSSFQFLEPFLRIFFKNHAEANAEMGYYANKISSILGLVIDILSNGIYLTLVYLCVVSQISLAQLAMLTLLNTQFLSSIRSINYINIRLRDANASLSFINNIIVANKARDGGSKVEKPIEKIDVYVTRLGYEGVPLIMDSHFEAKKGQIVGIIGESGKGKTTLIKNIAGFLRDSGSKVLINGSNLESMDFSRFYESILYLPQTPAIFPISIKENFVFGCGSHITDAQIYKLRSVACLEKFFTFENGLDTVILEGSSNLSGGDRQKIALVRALISPSDVLILDEFTNSIDSDSAEALFMLIKEAYKEKIIILISHDQKIIKHCHTCYELIDGKLILS